MIEIKSNGLETQVFIDGIEIKGIQRISFQASVGYALPELCLTLKDFPKKGNERKE